MRGIARIVIVGLALVAWTGVAQAQSGYDLFQQALVKERAEGKLEQAIELYQRIVREYAADRALVARALVQMGRSYEKLGRPEAREAYARVVREYADQPEPTALATDRLMALRGSAFGNRGAVSEEEQGVVFRQIDFEGLERTPFARLSPDGSKLLYVHVQELQPRFSIRVRDLASGEEQVLVENVGETNYFAWSPDGSKIVYRRRRELRAVDTKGGDLTVLWSSPDDGIVAIPLDWSTDGRLILAAIRDLADWTQRLAIFPSSGGPPRHLVSGKFLDLEEHGQFSPDGTHIAGVQVKDGNKDIYLWAADGSDEIRVTHHRAEDDSPFWSPDGRYLVFRSDRTGERDLWVLPMVGPTPDGAARRIKTGLGKRTWITELLPTGQLTMLMIGDGTPHDLFVLPVDPLSGVATGDFLAFAKFPTQHSMTGTRWSPDGSRVVYKSRKGEIGWPRIFVGLGAGREDIEIPVEDHYIASVEWGHRGEHLIFAGSRRDGRAGIFSLSLKDYTVEPLHLAARVGARGVGALVNLQWLPAAGKFFLQEIADSAGMKLYMMDEGRKAPEAVMDRVATRYWMWPSPDGRHVAYRRESSLQVVSLDDHVSRTLMEWPDGPWFDVMPAWSPDGSRIAWTDRRQLIAVATDGGIAQTLVVAPDGSQIVAPPAWAPDGSNIAYVVRDTTVGEPYHPDELWVIPSSGGSPFKLADAPSTHPRLRLDTWRPDGTIAATGAPPPDTSGSGYQHWVLEGFLPEETRAARR